MTDRHPAERVAAHVIGFSAAAYVPAMYPWAVPAAQLMLVESPSRFAPASAALIAAGRPVAHEYSIICLLENPFAHRAYAHAANTRPAFLTLRDEKGYDIGAQPKTHAWD
jgi:hypothetical protein